MALPSFLQSRESLLDRLTKQRLEQEELKRQQEAASQSSGGGFDIGSLILPAAVGALTGGVGGLFTGGGFSAPQALLGGALSAARAIPDKNVQSAVDIGLQLPGIFSQQQKAQFDVEEQQRKKDLFNRFFGGVGGGNKQFGLSNLRLSKVDPISGNIEFSPKNLEGQFSHLFQGRNDLGQIAQNLPSFFAKKGITDPLEQEAAKIDFSKAYEKNIETQQKLFKSPEEKAKLKAQINQIEANTRLINSKIGQIGKLGNITTQQKNQIAQLTIAERNINDLFNLYDQIPKAPGITGRGLGFIQETQAKLGGNAIVNRFNAQRDALSANVARTLGEVGVLTDQDIQRAVNALPKIGATPEEVKLNKVQLRSLLANAKAGIAESSNFLNQQMGMMGGITPVPGGYLVEE